jgi:hypothetical protein
MSDKMATEKDYTTKEVNKPEPPNPESSVVWKKEKPSLKVQAKEIGISTGKGIMENDGKVVLDCFSIMLESIKYNGGNPSIEHLAKAAERLAVLLKTVAEARIPADKVGKFIEVIKKEVADCLEEDF